ncbi:MAG: polyprenyl synthetase family protein [Planctomycetales bacterium]|nr:polyprenyl synthetase family protein [Planctomycetales bacterium]MCA9203402.1 polyprenyl synthetase family protein [Planctomycetales bacterium]
MATAPVSRPLVESLPETRGEKRRSRRRQTAHLKGVPQSKALRESMRAKCQEVADRLDKDRPLTKDEMEAVARALLEEIGQPESYLGWTMVMLATAFWQDQVASIPPSRRLFLLPHCLKHAEGCPADYDEFGLDCKTCGACSIADFRTMAEDMGYKVLVAEGSPIVLKIIVSGYVDAIVGVACLNVLEKAIDKILLAGIPCMAVPLLSSDCRNTSVDEDWVSEMIRVKPRQAATTTRTYVHLMRAASRMFEPDELERLAPRLRGGPRLAEANGQGIGALDPIAATEALAYDFLSKGGKHSRPFITLAVYDALTGGQGTSAAGAKCVEQFSDAVRRTAMSIETFHKASLVHDDIEDNDQYRYGQPTMHRQHGISTAINVGDYMIGLGYRLVSRDTATLGAETTAEILDRLADAHLKLSEGQGAELLWRDSLEKRLKPIDALKIYALKTAPAFEAALYCGARLAGPADQYAEPIKQFARNLGVAFQILNDLNDWQGDANNKLSAGGDTLGGRPTVLWALALEQLPADKQEELLALVGDDTRSAEYRVSRVRQLYQEANVFEQAHRLVDKHQQRAESVADSLENDELRRLFYYLIDSVLERPEETVTAPVALSLAAVR